MLMLIIFGMTAALAQRVICADVIKRFIHITSEAPLSSLSPSRISPKSLFSNLGKSLTNSIMME